jgi:signal transduction histidine kinase
VEVASAAMPPDAEAERRRFAEINAGNEAIINPRIDAHLEAYRAALNDLRQIHMAVAEKTDLDLAGDTRQAAGWQVAGRVIGLLDAAVVLAHFGLASEVAPTLRSVHEGNQLLRTLISHRETSILEDWLKGHHIKPSRVLRAEDRFQKAVAAEMEDAGVEPPRRTRDYMAALYEFLSEMSHVRRSRVAEIVSVEQRLMPTGPHPDARLRGTFVYYTGVHLMDSTAVVGFALGTSLGDWAVLRTQDAFQALSRLIEEIPLDPDSLQGA